MTIYPKAKAPTKHAMAGAGGAQSGKTLIITTTQVPTKAKASTKAYGFRTTKIPLSKSSDQPLAPMDQPLSLAAATIF